MLREALAKAIYADQANKKILNNYDSLIRKEAVIGGQLFGKLPAGHRREFYNLDKQNWVWYEERINSKGIKQVRNTTYTISFDGIIKSHDGLSCSRISYSEARNLLEAIKLYYKKVSKELYQQVV
jgi:hypothetical protein